MGCTVMNDTDTVIDIECCVDMRKEVGTLAISDDKIANIVSITVSDVPMSIDELGQSATLVNLSGHLKTADELPPELGKNSKREKRKTMSAKKPPKPPRPPRGLSLDAADQKLIKEISELAMIKRARIERRKALKKMRVAKASSISTSSSGNLIAMLFTILFCIVVIFQGCRPSGSSPMNRSAIPIPGSLESNGLADGNIVGIQDQRNLATSGVPLTSVRSPDVTELVPGSDSKDDVKKAVD